jgi:hypothetical protein
MVRHPVVHMARRTSCEVLVYPNPEVMPTSQYIPANPDRAGTATAVGEFRFDVARYRTFPELGVQSLQAV